MENIVMILGLKRQVLKSNHLSSTCYILGDRKKKKIVSITYVTPAPTPAISQPLQ